MPSPWRALGARFGTFGLATAAIGFPTTTSSATKKAKNWSQAVQARAMLEAAWPSENEAKARRSTLASSWPRTSSPGPAPSSAAKWADTPARSRR